MKELLEYIVKSITDKPEEVRIQEEQGEDGRIIFRLEVASEDKGRVIGRQGRVAEAIRTLLRVAAIKRGVRAVLEIQ
ncbi:MAG: KH domain-containing protein [Chloroflexi bacterium]|nr:KH domain-containing protein [Chloroflexota bacterium]